jgi:hypothetical protein
MSVKNSNDTIGNRSRDLPVCNAVPQPLCHRVTSEKYGRTRMATGDNTAHALCMLDNEGHRRTFRISNTYCFCMTVIFTRTRLHVTLYVDGLSCFSSVYRHIVTQIPSTDHCCPLPVTAQRWEWRISGVFFSAVQANHSPAIYVILCTALYYTVPFIVSSEHNSSEGAAGQLEAFCVMRGDQNISV